MDIFLKDKRLTLIDDSKRFTDRERAHGYACRQMSGRLTMEHQDMKITHCGYTAGDEGQYNPYVTMEYSSPWAGTFIGGIIVGVAVVGGILLALR